MTSGGARVAMLVFASAALALFGLTDENVVFVATLIRENLVEAASRWCGNLFSRWQ